MTVIEAYHSLSAPVPNVVETRAAGEDALASAQRASSCDYDRWQKVIDEQLVEWGRGVARREDEDFVPPSPLAIRSAGLVAMELRDRGLAAPMRVVPDGEGGIVFERWHGPYFETFDIHADGSVEWAYFENCRLRARHRLP